MRIWLLFNAILRREHIGLALVAQIRQCMYVNQPEYRSPPPGILDQLSKMSREDIERYGSIEKVQCGQ